MQIGIASTGTNSGTLDTLVTEAQETRDAGLSSFWVPNSFGMDALTSLAVVGREVGRLRLGTAVVPIATRHPFALAQQALTVQAAVDGRLVLGIGTSHRVVVERAWGLPFERPAATMRAYLAELRAFVQPSGEVPPAPAAPDGPTPPRVPGAAPVPVYVAAVGPRMVEVAGAEADGLVLWATGARAVATIVAGAGAAATAAGRGEPPPVVVSLPVCVTDDEDRGRARIRRWFGGVEALPTYRRALDADSATDVADVSLVGTAGEVTDAVRRIEDTGAHEFTAMVVTGSGDERAATLAALHAAVAS